MPIKLRPVVGLFGLDAALIPIAVFMSPTSVAEDKVSASADWIKANLASIVGAMVAVTAVIVCHCLSSGLVRLHIRAPSSGGSDCRA
jgi:hypothetical protein